MLNLQDINLMKRPEITGEYFASSDTGNKQSFRPSFSINDGGGNLSHGAIQNEYREYVLK